MKKLKGIVISMKSEKTVVVRVDTKMSHPIYKKVMKRSKKFLVDETKKVNVGDFVEIVETKPISKKKHFKITKLIKENK